MRSSKHYTAAHRRLLKNRKEAEDMVESAMKHLFGAKYHTLYHTRSVLLDIVGRAYAYGLSDARKVLRGN